jgi:transcriptional regulator with XRE-family HTH domain
MRHDANLIGKKVGRLRYAKGWTQEILAAKLQILQCDVSREVVANIENRRSVATDKHCFFLAKVFNVSIDELFRP